jgi:hypothetical protein
MMMMTTTTTTQTTRISSTSSFKTHQHISSRLLSEMFCCITSRSQCPDKQT